MAQDAERPSEIRPFSLRTAILSTQVCGGLGWIGIVLLQRRNFLAVLMGSPPGGSQIVPILAGFLHGGVFGVLAWLLVRQPFMMGVTRRYVALTAAVRGWPAIIVVSLFAGAGEEVLFRGFMRVWEGLETVQARDEARVQLGKDVEMRSLLRHKGTSFGVTPGSVLDLSIRALDVPKKRAPRLGHERRPEAEPEPKRDTGWSRGS